MLQQKRVAAIHDISGFGKCSLTVALPILSAAGIETSVIPTAILSTHTGGFTDFTYRDLTEDIVPIAKHWRSLNLKFDSIYTGFLGSFEQIDLACEIFDILKSDDTLILVDPAMADNGVLYSIFPPDFPRGMRKLCGKADIIIPNLTEAAFLLDEPYVPGPYTQEYIEGLLQRLGGIGAKQVALTGVYFQEKELGAATYDVASGKVGYAFAPKIPGYYHGTGDVFASAFLAALLNGCSLEEAIKVAVDFTAGSIERTRQAGTDVRFGVNFEAGVPGLLQALKLLP